MITYSQAILLGILQGITELFPISSLGHSVLLPSVLHWHTVQSDPLFLSFLVVTHLATALVLLAFFWRDWLAILYGILRSLAIREIRESDTYAKIGWLLIVSTIPAGVLGILFEEKLKLLFASPKPVAIFLLLNGAVLYGAEVLRKRRDREERDTSQGDRRIARLSWMQAVEIGLLQCLALVPGFSRTGSTLGGGLLIGLTHQDAARYSFLMATPIIFAASALEIPSLVLSGRSGIYGPAAVAALAAAAAAYVSVTFLTNYFKTKTLTLFAAYCVIAGSAALLFL